MISSAHQKAGVYPLPSRPVVTRRRLRFNGKRLPVLVVVLLFVYLALSFVAQYQRLEAMQRDLGQLQVQLEELQKRNTELREQLKQVQSDSYIEQVARQRLGLVKPGESRVVPVKPQQ
ncbi:MAG: septum formation initiator family protein, partial [Thermoanaerobacteraceae bacterium]|nr:septum formation initiator family protein [Thermoanaerobacteraceae bacterium]